MSDNNKFIFTVDQIKFVAGLRSRATSGDAEKMRQIVRTQVNPKFHMCCTCNGAAAKVYGQLKNWMNEFLGCDITTLKTEAAIITQLKGDTIVKVKKSTTKKKKKVVKAKG